MIVPVQSKVQTAGVAGVPLAIVRTRFVAGKVKGVCRAVIAG